jgi:hypothetical protein
MLLKSKYKETLGTPVRDFSSYKISYVITGMG